MLKDFDLNTLQVLNAVIECKSVTEAANTLNMSPSSVTYAINKIRKITANPIFTRAKHGVSPTTMALELNNRFIKAMEIIQEGMKFSSNTLNLDVESSITISTYTYLELWFTCLLLKDDVMSRIRLNFIKHQKNIQTRVSQLRNHEVDLDIGSALPYDPSIISQKIVSSKYKVLASANNSIVGDELTLESWKRCKHIKWTKMYDELYSSIDDAKLIDEMNSLDVEIISDSSLNSLFICSLTDYLLVIPEYLEDFFVKVLPVKSFDLPFETSTESSIYAHYHRTEKNSARINASVAVLQKLKTLTSAEELLPLFN